MATRLNKRQQDSVRDTIKGSQLVNLVQDYALEGAYNGHEIKPARITAALGLLKKIIPDLKAQELSGADGEALTVVVRQYGRDRDPQ